MKKILITLLAFALAVGMLIPTATPAVAAVGLNLAARWDFNSITSGTVADLSGNNNTLTINGATSAAVVPTALFGNALSFDGTDDYASAANSPSLDITGPITVEGWIYLKSFSQQATIAGKWEDINGTNNRGYLLTVDLTGHPRFYVSTDGTNYPVAIGPQLSVNTWYHLAGTFDGTNVQVYVGSSPTPTSLSGSINSNDQSLLIGANDGWGGSDRKFTDGYIDEVRVWNSVLGAAQLDDMLPPVVTSPNENAVYSLNQAVNADWSVNDGTGSGPGNGVTGVDPDSISASVANGSPLDTSTPGSHSYTVSASDYAKNSVTQTINYTVEYEFGGFLPPLEINGKGNGLFKAGSTIPVKFQLTDANGNHVNTADGTASIDTSPAVSAPVRYDTADMQYIANLKTIKGQTGIYTLSINLSDGSTHSIGVTLK